MERLSWRSHASRSRYAVDEKKKVKSAPSLIFLLGVAKVWVCGLEMRESFGVAEGVGVEAMAGLHCSVQEPGTLCGL
jgi:hypothetical protein